MRERVYRLLAILTLAVFFVWQRGEIVRQEEELRIMRVDLDRVQRTNEMLPSVIRAEIANLHRELVAYWESHPR